MTQQNRISSTGDSPSSDQTLATEASAQAARGAAPRLRLHFLDGIRGLAALYVLLFHSLTIAVPQDNQQLSAPMRVLRALFGYGHFAVAVFIVLSGFSLTLPMARKASLQLRNGFGNYVWRRCRRVMPPYYAALALSIVAILASSLIDGADTTAQEEALTPGSIISHLFLVHNMNFDWAFRINGPLWSVATEFQIYFLFPLVLLPLWRRIGALPTVVLCWAAAALLQFGVPESQNLAWAAPWFVGSFALGMWAAFIGFSPGFRRSWAQDFPWGTAALVLLGAVALALAIGGGTWPLIYLDAVVSVMALCWILACVARYHRSEAEDAEADDADDTNPNERQPSTSLTLNGVLGSKSMVLLGSFSYSAYVLQHPLLRLTETLLGRTSMSFEMILWVQFLIGTPIILAASWLFAQFFELPFTTGSPLVDWLRQRLLPKQHT